MEPAMRKLQVARRDRMAKNEEGYYVYHKAENKRDALALAEELSCELSFYSPDRLNNGQRCIYDYMHANPNAMIIIQAGPGEFFLCPPRIALLAIPLTNAPSVLGTGKTFTLLTLAYSWRKRATCYAIIYKHDLLLPFLHVARRYTVAKFIMETLRIGYFQYQALETQLCGRLSNLEFIIAMIALLRRAKLPDMLGSLVILDEYTVVPKPLLLITLLLLKLHRIGTIVCGDRNQLQNIHNSSHTRVSSYELARRIADKTFNLDINERCSDNGYNRVIDYIACFASNRRIDDFACSIIAAVFPRKLMGNSTYSDTHLAATHRELAQVVHNMTVNENIPTSFYYIDTRCVALDRQVTETGLLVPRLVERYMRERAPDKFLPYLPLRVGAKYYLYKLSDTMQATLRSVDAESLGFELRDGTTICVQKRNNNDVVFEPHRLELLGEDGGKIYNYPIYPANIMTTHKCQGCTIYTKLDLHITNMTHQGLYVAMSRVRDPGQIVRITMPNAVAHICSAIVNFPELCDVDQLEAETLASRLASNYVLYQPTGEISKYVMLIADFFEGGISKRRKREIRISIIDLLMSQKCAQRIVAPPVSPEENNGTTILRFLDHKDIFVTLACLDDTDRMVWLHEYVRSAPNLMPLISNDERNYDAQTVRPHFGNVLTTLTGINNYYPMSRSTLDYLSGRAKQEFRLASDDAECEAQRKRTIFYEGEGQYLAMLVGSEFQARIYKRLAASESKPIETEWLLSELNAMLAVARDQRELEPEKTPNLKRRNNELSDIEYDTTNVPLVENKVRVDGRFLAKRRGRKI